MQLEKAERISAPLRASAVIPFAVLVLCAAICGLASAAPINGTVAGGTAAISAQGTTTRVQQTSPRAVINWQRFDVAPTETVVFAQPSSNAIVLNRVVNSTAPSNILGSISANGRVFIVNQRGIVFGPGAQVNVGDLVATTADIASTANFMAGDSGFRALSPTTSQIINRGKIAVPAGHSVLLLAPSVANQGDIKAHDGAVVLATGRAFFVDYFGDGLLQIAAAAVTGPPSGPITQIGRLDVGQGTVLIRHAFGATSLIGTLNGVAPSEMASQAVVLPGGSIAFVGASTRPPLAIVDPSWFRTDNGGGGIIDASPRYTLFPPQEKINRAAPFDPPTASESARLAEFNRLGEFAAQRPSGISNSADDSSPFGSGALYTVGEPARTPLAQAVGFTSEPPAAQPASKQDSAKPRCTVAQLLSSQGCR